MNNEELRTFEKARAAIADNLRASVAAIDGAFGKGYAGNHPELVAAYLQACALADISVSLAEIGALVRDGLINQ